MEKNKYYYIVPSIIITVIIMFIIYSPQITELKEKLSTKESYIEEYKNTEEEQKNTINHLKEENKQLQSQIDDLQKQDSTSESTEEQVVVNAPQDDISLTTESLSTTEDNLVKINPTEKDYVLNTSTKKFHFLDCSSVSTIKSSNRKDYTGSRDDVINMGYSPCKRCNP